MTQWQVIVPVKAFSVGKSRISSDKRPAFARAFALDTISAAARCGLVGRVIVVSDEPQLDAAAFAESEDNPHGLSAAEAKKVLVLRDAPEGLNPAISYAVQMLEHTNPADRVAVLLGDLPALHPSDLSTALYDGVHAERSFVGDADGTGTTLLMASRATKLVPAFGRESASWHKGLGYQELKGDYGNLTRDVDTADVLASFDVNQLSPNTRALVSATPALRLRDTILW